MSPLAVAGHVLAGLGGFILFASGLGVLRMPDAWNRMHAGTKATTLGTMAFMIGVGLIEPGWLPKLVLLVLFVILTNPVSSHALARAVHMREDERPDNLERDDLEGRGEEAEE